MGKSCREKDTDWVSNYPKYLISKVFQLCYKIVEYLHGWNKTSWGKDTSLNKKFADVPYIHSLKIILSNAYNCISVCFN